MSIAVEISPLLVLVPILSLTAGSPLALFGQNDENTGINQKN